jgi:hypothetical protein
MARTVLDTVATPGAKHCHNTLIPKMLIDCIAPHTPHLLAKLYATNCQQPIFARFTNRFGRKLLAIGRYHEDAHLDPVSRRRLPALRGQ